jgi:hypothetical protein
MKRCEKVRRNGDEPTVNKNGHLEYVSAGVCNLGSSTEMKGCAKKMEPMSEGPSHDDVRTYVYQCVETRDYEVSIRHTVKARNLTY